MTVTLPDNVETALSDLLYRIAQRLDPLWGDGHGANFEAPVPKDWPDDRPPPAGFSMRRFCWCESPECPLCQSSLEQPMDLSAERAEELRPLFRRQSFLEGEGAPNFVVHGPNGDRLRIWWYKYIGRGTKADRPISLDDVAALSQQFDIWIEENRESFLAARLGMDLVEIAPDMDAGLLRGLAAGAARAAMATQDPDGSVTTLLNTFYKQAYKAQQHDLAGDALEELGVPEIANPDEPEEMQLGLSLSARLGQLCAEVLRTRAALTAIRDGRASDPKTAAAKALSSTAST